MALMNALSAPASLSGTPGPLAGTPTPSASSSPSGSDGPRFDEALQQARQPATRTPDARGTARGEADAPPDDPAARTDADTADAVEPGGQAPEADAAATRQARAAARQRLRLEAAATQAGTGVKGSPGADPRAAAAAGARAEAAASAMATEAGAAQRWAAALRGQRAGDSPSQRAAPVSDLKTAATDDPNTPAGPQDSQAARTVGPDASAGTAPGAIDPALMPLTADASVPAVRGTTALDRDDPAVSGVTAAADNAASSRAAAAEARGVDTGLAGSAAAATATAGMGNVFMPPGPDTTPRAPMATQTHGAVPAAPALDSESARTTPVALSAEAGSRKALGAGFSTESSAAADGMRLLGAWSSGAPSLSAEAAGAFAPSQPANPAADSTPLGALPQDTLDTPVDSPAFSGALGARIAWMARDGLERAQLNVHPAELGPVQVQLSMDGNQVRVDLTADASATRQVLEQALPSLASALRDAGFTLAGGGVFQQAQDRPGHPDRAPDASMGSRRADGDMPPVGAIGPVTTAVRRQGLVDLFA